MGDRTKDFVAVDEVVVFDMLAGEDNVAEPPVEYIEVVNAALAAAAVAGSKGLRQEEAVAQHSLEHSRAIVAKGKRAPEIYSYVSIHQFSCKPVEP